MTLRRIFSKPMTGRKVLAYFLGFFGVVFGANLIMVFFAITTFSGVETDDAYRKGRDYNDTLAEAAEQRELGWDLQIETKVSDGNLVSCIAIMRDKDGQGLEEMKVEAIFRRPAHQGIDQTITLVDMGGGNYVGHVQLTAPGNWEIWIKALGQNGEQYRSQRQFFLKS